MSGLVLKLSPKERLLINGAVLENGPRRSRLSVVTPNANILRLKDALHPEDTKTPVRRVCYIAQLVLSGDITRQQALPQLTLGISQLKQVLPSGRCFEALNTAHEAAQSGQFYQCLKALRQLISVEDTLLASVGT